MICLWWKALEETSGRRKSSTGCGGLWRILRCASWRKVRAADDECEVVSCEQLRVIDRDAMAFW